MVMANVVCNYLQILRSFSFITLCIVTLRKNISDMAFLDNQFVIFIVKVNTARSRELQCMQLLVRNKPGSMFPFK